MSIGLCILPQRSLFITSVFTITRKWNQPTCPLIHESIMKMWCRNTEEVFQPQRKMKSWKFRKIDRSGKHYTKWDNLGSERQLAHVLSQIQVPDSKIYICRVSWESVWAKARKLARCHERVEGFIGRGREWSISDRKVQRGALGVKEEKGGM